MESEKAMIQIPDLSGILNPLNVKIIIPKILINLNDGMTFDVPKACHDSIQEHNKNRDSLMKLYTYEFLRFGEEVKYIFNTKNDEKCIPIKTWKEHL